MSTPIILGIDEVGRGPWAGPLVVGAAILSPEFCDCEQHPIIKKLTPSSTAKDEVAYIWQHLTDSKKLTSKRRTELAPLIIKHAAASGTGWVSSAELDRYGMSASLKLATRRAVKQILATKIPFTEIIIDGTVNFLSTTPLADRVTTLKKADLLVKEVSAASIIAKVARDTYMIKLAEQYPGYGFENHMGYGTAAHQKALETRGICPEHRQSFRPIQEILIQSEPKTVQNTIILPKNTLKSPICPLATSLTSILIKAPSTSQKGQTAELAVADYLKTQNHEIIEHNFKTKTCEIDLISVQNREIYFTEVKYSHNSTSEGTPLVRITSEKQRQMRFAAQVFLKTHPEYADFQPLLAAASVSGSDFQVTNWFVLE